MVLAGEASDRSATGAPYQVAERDFETSFGWNPIVSRATRKSGRGETVTRQGDMQSDPKARRRHRDTTISLAPLEFGEALLRIGPHPKDDEPASSQGNEEARSEGRRRGHSNGQGPEG